MYRSSKEAARAYDRARDLLEAWERVRPLLYFSQCPYARGLIMTMIEAWTYLLETGYEYDSEVLQILYHLLNNLPPDNLPPAGMPAGGFSV